MSEDKIAEVRRFLTGKPPELKIIMNVSGGPLWYDNVTEDRVIDSVQRKFGPITGVTWNGPYDLMVWWVESITRIRFVPVDYQLPNGDSYQDMGPL